MKAEQTAILYPERYKCAPVISVRESVVTFIDAQYISILTPQKFEKVLFIKYSHLLTLHANNHVNILDLQPFLHFPDDKTLQTELASYRYHQM